MGLTGQLILQGGTQVLIQLQQGPQQASLQCCRVGSSTLGQGSTLLQAWDPQLC